jgi:hypothetical protein
VDEEVVKSKKVFSSKGSYYFYSGYYASAPRYRKMRVYERGCSSFQKSCVEGKDTKCCSTELCNSAINSYGFSSLNTILSLGLVTFLINYNQK